MSWSWIISQVLMIVYIRFASWHHAPAVNAMREYVPTPNPYEDPFHAYSFLQAAVVALCIVLGLLSYQPIAWCIVSGLLSAFYYWLLFDIWLNLGTHKNWDYLGNDPTTDSQLKKWFGNNAGRCKAILLSALIVAINILRWII